MIFISPTKGPMSFETMFQDITSFMEEDKDAEYKLIVGTDSQVREDVNFVTAVIVHRLGKGGRYYYTRVRARKMPSLKQRIFYEAHLSLDLASKLAAEMASNGHSDLNVEIHLDVGRNGETRALIKDLVAVIVGSGFAAKIKPDAYGASQVADKHSK
ncbi:MAG: ribonuclease H-like YkuK family protein [Firmicutes bacterium]|nr:ribonuclease H-like YkuK family protein [Candidatus Fermentithermobacillaceae bacterium]